MSENVTEMSEKGYLTFITQRAPVARWSRANPRFHLASSSLTSPVGRQSVGAELVNEIVSILTEQVLHMPSLEGVQRLQEYRDCCLNSFADVHQNLVSHVQVWLQGGGDI